MADIDKDRLASDIEALSDFNRAIVEEFRANDGKISNLPGGELLLLHHTGAKSGESRLSPLAYVRVGGRMLVVGSSLGSPKHPAWVHNLRAHPRCRVEVGTDDYAVVARELPREERDALFPSVTAAAPVLADYQAKTDRVIPLFELTRG
ncbi:nitroreductase family deazaflavin-dependent oxidoreductase [Solirubrobacter phytolaccae]|uniref:Nitroreductase family deazaflavin-dependent oxidoreductase n=1 Tax=Solirubrobacter phytolaccae TaxID=1404360 RepID=A0A9X3S6Q2_9ACTN|nr:nitroreductase family deazaflavin-dependent oxidoreductase [Solirubrobacter phytolaccae]MDA0179388.1 nitroreductase family deazaflavin-dependent oxidoreductase [Solirubrobacter phytolaccae]